jgi:hypothetical protein
MPEFIPSGWSIRAINPTYKLMAIFHTDGTPNRAAGQDRLFGRQPSVTDRWFNRFFQVLSQTNENAYIFLF